MFRKIVSSPQISKPADTATETGTRGIELTRFRPAKRAADDLPQSEFVEQLAEHVAETVEDKTNKPKPRIGLRPRR